MGFRGPQQAYISSMSADARGIIRTHAAATGEPYDLCARASLKLMDGLLTDGISASILRCDGLKTNAPDADARWIKMAPQSLWVHFVVKVGEDVVDLTRRQFFPVSGYPHVQSYDACVAEWANIVPVR